MQLVLILMVMLMIGSHDAKRLDTAYRDVHTSVPFIKLVQYTKYDWNDVKVDSTAICSLFFVDTETPQGKIGHTFLWVLGVGFG